MTATAHPSRRCLAATATACALLLGGCSANGGTPTGTDTSMSPGTTTAVPATSPTTSSPTTDVPLPTAAPTRDPRGLAVYWVGESRDSYALYREFRNVPDQGGPIASAIVAMTRMRPLDPDYTTPWRAVNRVGVTQSGDALTVDLPASAVDSTMVGAQLGELAVQQLVHTAVDAAAWLGHPVSTVTITIDGRPATAWGGVQLGAPVAPKPDVEVFAHAWVTAPQHGERVPAGTVTFKGYGTSFEATFTWEVTTQAGAKVAGGMVMGGTGTGGFGELTWSAKLKAGTYVVRLMTDDPSGGAAPGGPAVDTKTFTVR